MKTCTKCKESKDYSEFHKNPKAPDGHKTECAVCSRKRKNAWRKKNAESERQKWKQWRSKNKEHRDAYQKEYMAKHLKENAEYWNARNSKRRAAKLKATPAWADKVAIDYIYYAAKVIERVYGTKWHVDHIIPLKGKTVCGLHVQNNLQLLAPLDNIKKSNKLGGY